MVLSILNQKKNWNGYFVPQRKHLKSQVDCKRNRKWKMETTNTFFLELRFFVNKPIKNKAEYVSKQDLK